MSQNFKEIHLQKTFNHWFNDIKHFLIILVIFSPVPSNDATANQNCPKNSFKQFCLTIFALKTFLKALY